MNSPAETLARAVLSRGLAPPERVQAALRQCEVQPGLDLLQLLVQQGALRAADAEAIRRDPGGRALAAPLATVSDALLVRPGDGGRPLESTLKQRADLVIEGALAGRYELIDERIAAGGMGFIAKARHKAMGNLVAIKMLLAEQSELVNITRFQGEARALAGLRHPGIVRVTDFGTEGGRPWCIMEWLDGETFADELARGDCPPERVIAVFRKLARALAYCHAEGIVHRDLKPANIMIVDDEPILVDFGLAREVPRADMSTAPDAMELSGSEEAIGTPAYMAPEQADPSGEFGEPGPQTDVWGLGATLFEALTGRPPYVGKSVHAVMRELLTREPPRVVDIAPDAPPELAELCEDMMQLRSEDRLTMAEVAETLDRLASPDRGPWLIAGGLIMAALLGAVLSVLRAPPLDLVELDTGPGWRRESAAIIRGRANRAGCPVSLDGLRGVTDGDGAFEFRVVLEPGLKTFKLALGDGDAARHSSFVLGRDVQPPKLEFTRLGPRGEVVLDRRGRLAGRVVDESPKSLTVGGTAVELDDEGRFVSAPLTDRIGTRQAIVATDSVGRELRRTITLLDFDQGEKHERAEAILRDLELWSSASEELQQFAAEEVERRLGKSFHLTGFKRTVCGSIAHRVAVFEFRKDKLAKRFHLIPGGRFRMGLDPADVPALERSWAGLGVSYKREWLAWEQPASEVTIRRPFLMAETETSWQEFMQAYGRMEKKVVPDAMSMPVRGVSWNDVVAWLETLGDGIRLPSEAEWEFAARAGSRDSRPWGAKPDDARCVGRWIGRPVSVDAMPETANAFGLRHILGNVAEWCADAWVPRAYERPVDERPIRHEGGAVDISDQIKAQKQLGRVFRGGGFRFGWPRHRVAWRDRADRSRPQHARTIGVRLAVTIPDPKPLAGSTAQDAPRDAPGEGR